MNILKKILQSAGMDANEAVVYLACLKMGMQAESQIANETGLTKYDIIMTLTSLYEKGFVDRISRGKNFYTAKKPQDILKVLEKNKLSFENNIKVFSESLSVFGDFVNPDVVKPEIKIYEGRAGVINAYEDTLTSTTDINAIASIDDTETCFPNYVRKYYKKRKASGILIKAIFPDSKMARERQKMDEEELRISRLLPRDYLDFSIELNIYEDKVAYFSIKEKVAIIVKSKFITNSMRNMFQLCWKIADNHHMLKIADSLK